MILYIGNKLSKHGNTPTSVETLGPLLSMYYRILCVSDKVGKIRRLEHIVRSIVRNRGKLKLVLIDTYSTQGFYFALVSAVFALVLNIPYILLLRGGNLEFRLRQSPRFSRFLFGRSYRLVAPSHFLFEAFRARGYRNLLYIPNNIEVCKYTFTVRQKFRPRILWVRSFSEIYNPSMAVDVIKHLTQSHPDVKLCMVGPDKDGSLKNVIAYTNALGLSGNIKFAGKLDKADWHQLSTEYDIFINTANIDNTPVSLIEALALGLPVVTTNVGGIPYLIKHEWNGLLVDANDTMGMVGAVRRIMEDTRLGMSLSERGRAFILDFDWDRIKNQWISMIDSAMK